MKLHGHQERALKDCRRILSEEGCVYLAGEVRTGKTLVALHLAYGLTTQVLFVTKKMAINGIQKQVKESGLALNITITNYEQLHKLKPIYDVVIIDEAHTLGMYPKPARRARLLCALTLNTRVVMLSGTPSPESFSQLFHQFWAANAGPWKKFKNFYAWARVYVDVQKQYFAGVAVNDYSHARMDLIESNIRPYVVAMTQADAGFVGTVLDRIHTVELAPGTIEAIKAVANSGVFRPLGLKAMSAAQRMAYVHQLCSGTVISLKEMVGDTNGTLQERLWVDYSKVDYIRKQWGRKRKAIFYCYVAEGELLRKWYPNNTASPEEFKANPKLDFICQIKSGQEGVDLSDADVIIFYNISYSAASYFQGRARGQNRAAATKEVHWLFSNYGFEKNIYELITGDHGKKRYTAAHFRSYVESVGDKSTSLRRLSRY